VRVSADVKSGLYVSRKWAMEEGTFALRVPAIAEAKGLRDYLWSRAEPAAQYTTASGRVVAWQWHLKFGKDRSLWKGCINEVR